MKNLTRLLRCKNKPEEVLAVDCNKRQRSLAYYSFCRVQRFTRPAVFALYPSRFANGHPGACETAILQMVIGPKILPGTTGWTVGITMALVFLAVWLGHIRSHRWGLPTGASPCCADFC